MYLDRDDAALPAPGCPIRESTGQRLFNASPWLIAVVHALHRLLVPRHPPCALTILTVISLARSPRKAPTETGDTQICLANCAVFKVRAKTPDRTKAPSIREPGDGRSLKTQQRATPRPRQRLYGAPGPVDMLGTPAPRGLPTGSLVRKLPRKEVIQPQLPLRLPCYDFTPITSPTFDGSLPCGLGHRLRVLPAFVV